MGGLAACGGGDSGEDRRQTSPCGSTCSALRLRGLYKQFEADHPGVTIVETAEGDLGQYNTQLTQQIAAGSGAGDVVAIEEGQVVNFLQTPTTS